PRRHGPQLRARAEARPGGHAGRDSTASPEGHVLRVPRHPSIRPRSSPALSASSARGLPSTGHPPFGKSDAEHTSPRRGRHTASPEGQRGSRLPQGGERHRAAPGTPFALPQLAWILETYDPDLGTPDDACFAADALLASLDPIQLTIDGVSVLTNANKEDLYVDCAPLDPPIMYADPTHYGAIGAIAFRSVGFASPPLPPGGHVIHLYEELILPEIFGVICDNTWNTHVEPSETTRRLRAAASRTRPRPRGRGRRSSATKGNSRSARTARRGHHRQWS
ncbi:MAG: hypothetical protein ACUVYA_14430, partial [Planctomycetota bacterium]